MVNLKAGPGI